MIDMVENQKLETLSDRLNHAISVIGISQAELARLINVKPQTIQYLSKQKAEWSKFTFELAHALGVRVEWLATGKGEMLPPQNRNATPELRVPILTVQQVKELNRDIVVLDLSSYDEWLVTSSKVSGQAFAMRIFDHSMWPRFDENTIIILDPQHKAQNANFAIIYVAKLDTIFFRELQFVNNTITAIPLNTTMFKEFDLTEEDKILGVMIEARWTVN